MKVALEAKPEGKRPLGSLGVDRKIFYALEKKRSLVANFYHYKCMLQL
jgi:hypothetical protein